MSKGRLLTAGRLFRDEVFGVFRALRLSIGHIMGLAVQAIRIHHTRGLSIADPQSRVEMINPDISGLIPQARKSAGLKYITWAGFTRIVRVGRKRGCSLFKVINSLKYRHES